MTSCDAAFDGMDHRDLPDCSHHGSAARLDHAPRCDGRSPSLRYQCRIRDRLMRHNLDTDIRHALVLTCADTCTHGCPLYWRGSGAFANDHSMCDCRTVDALQTGRICAGTMAHHTRYT